MRHNSPCNALHAVKRTTSGCAESIGVRCSISLVTVFLLPPLPRSQMHGMRAARLSEDDGACISVVWRRITAASLRSLVERWMDAGTITVCSVVRRKHFSVRPSTKRTSTPTYTIFSA